MNSELKKKAEDFCDACPNEPENWDRRGTVEALVEFALSLMPDYEALIEQTRWIPVEERLPEKRMLVLVTNRLGSVFFDFYDSSVAKAWRSREPVLAWRSIEPYEPRN